MEKYGIGFHFFRNFVLMIKRASSKLLLELVRFFKVVAVIGPRQSGKTTLVKNLFPHKSYVNLEIPANLNFAIDDPFGFLGQFNGGVIIDEAQRAPHLFSYIQDIVDKSPKKGMFILTGSNNFLLNKSISQSLAGRVAYLQLFPFSYYELKNKTAQKETSHFLLEGFYPPVYDQKIPFKLWYPNYIKSYIERDVRQIKNINNLIHFEKFIRLLAGRSGQELNYNSLSVELGVDLKTVQSWVSVLEQSFLVFLLKPYHKNFNKTIVKRPKLYFYDSGLVCSLLGITSNEVLELHPFKGAIFETLVVSEFIKLQQSSGDKPQLYYWRDKTGREIDLIVEKSFESIAIEIKSGKTIQNSFFKNLDYWKKISGGKKTVLVYNGDIEQKRTNGTDVMNWKNVYKLFEH